MLAITACIDPIHDRDVSDLGPEDPAIAQGPLHRAGQPCTTCHGGEGPAKAVFSVAGTIYAVRGADDAQPGATVTLTDANGVVQTFTTNGVGNFYVLEHPGADEPSSAIGGKDRGSHCALSRSQRSELTPLRASMNRNRALMRNVHPVDKRARLQARALVRGQAVRVGRPRRQADEDPARLHEPTNGR